MRGLPARRIASTVLCACLLTGITGPVALAAEPAHQRPLAASRTPAPDTGTLLAQTRDLGDVLGVLAPVTALLNAVLKADNGQLPPDQAQKLADAVKEALASLPATTTTALPKADTADPAAGVPDATGTARADLADAVDAVLQAVTSGAAGSGTGAGSGSGSGTAALDSTVAKLVQGLVDVVAATLAAGGLPTPTLTGLPAVPTA